MPLPWPPLASAVASDLAPRPLASLMEDGTMDDARYGQRDKRGNWKPFKPVEYPAVFVWPLQPRGILQWLFSYPSYILPWNLLYAAIAVAVWMYLTPPVETLQTFAPGWIAFVFARNLCLVVLFFGAFHLRLYVSSSTTQNGRTRTTPRSCSATRPSTT